MLATPLAKVLAHALASSLVKGSNTPANAILFNGVSILYNGQPILFTNS